MHKFKYANICDCVNFIIIQLRFSFRNNYYFRNNYSYNESRLDYGGVDLADVVLGQSDLFTQNASAELRSFVEHLSTE